MSKGGFLGGIESWTRTLVIGAVSAYFINQVVVVNARVPSESMEGTIMTGDRFLGNRLAYLERDPERFDIVVFKYPDDEKQFFVKRIIGLPGEKVEIKAGKVYINNSRKALWDDYIPEEMKGDFGPYEVPANSYFVLGDNRNHSNDSRSWNHKFVERDSILGKAMFTYWPPDRIGPLE